MLKFKTGDQIIVTAGKDKGKKGKIIKVDPKKSFATIEGVNLYKKHVKGSQQQSQKGGIYDVPRPLSFGKISHIDPKSGKPKRVGFKTVKGKKVRVLKGSNTVLDK